MVVTVVMARTITTATRQPLEPRVDDEQCDHREDQQPGDIDGDFHCPLPRVPESGLVCHFGRRLREIVSRRSI